jgi:predicted CXXCH cytochrome family protein
MKIAVLNFKLLTSFVISILISWISMDSGPAYPQSKLKSGAKGALCLECHEAFKVTLKKRYVHPLKAEECIGCHSPHASSHKGLLNSGLTRLCYECHKDILPDNARSAHESVVKGHCTACHDAHASDNKSILIKPGNDLCLSCHNDIKEQVANNRFKHAPMDNEKGCLNCHTPHASARSGSLLKDNASLLCLGCHKTDSPSYKSKHMNFSVAGSNCISCHDPHGSSRKGLLYADTHAPVSEGKCMECHTSASNPKVLKTGGSGADLCKLCHQQMIDQVLSKKRVHWALFSQDNCLNCHNPHASNQKKLLSGSVSDVCGKCHSDTVALQAVSRNNPENKKLCEPVKSGNCVSCHSPHSADNVLLMPSGSIIDICSKCHEWQTHSSHPLGEKVVDQRNRNLTVDCLSCHRACGTGNNPTMLNFPSTYETCIQCHVERKR